MKTIKCYKCGVKIGEINKGIWSHNGFGICRDCIKPVTKPPPEVFNKSADDLFGFLNK